MTHVKPHQRPGHIMKTIACNLAFSAGNVCPSLFLGMLGLIGEYRGPRRPTARRARSTPAPSNPEGWNRADWLRVKNPMGEHFGDWVQQPAVHYQ